MSVFDYVLEGLEAALELERELGVRSVEIDRGVLGAGKPAEPSLPSRVFSPSGGTAGLETKDLRRETGPGHETRDVRPAIVNRTILDLVFLHDRALSPKGVEMMAKIITALGRTAENSPIVIAPPIPNAKIYVFLGVATLRKYMPGLRLGENCWGKSPKGKDVLLVKSPEEILRFATVTPAVQKIQEEMWRSLKAVRQRLSTS